MPLRPRLSLRRKLQAVLAALTGVVLGLAAVTLWATLRWQQADAELREHYQRSLLLQEVRAATFHAFKEVPEAILARDAGGRAEFDALIARVEKGFQAWADLAHNDVERRQVLDIRASHEAVIRHAHQVFDLIEAGQPGEASRVLEDQIEGEDFQSFEQRSAAAVESDRESRTHVELRSSRAREVSRIALGTATTATCALVALLGWYFIAGLFRPLQEVELALDDLGRGELDRRIPASASPGPASAPPRAADELTALVQAFNRTTDELSRTTVSKAYLDSIIESMVEALVVTAPDGTIRTANPAAGALLGTPRQELLGRPVTDFLGDGDPGPEEQVRNRETILRARSGTTIPVSLSWSVVRGADGSVLGTAFVAQDITDRKRAESQNRAALTEKEILLKEINHRVKNNLQIISSLLNLHARDLTDPATVQILNESRNRIQAMALVHEMLYRTEKPSHIPLDEYFENLTRHLLASFGAPAAGIRLVSRIAPLSMSLDMAIPCGLIINELVTNSLKHAFPRAAAGEIGIELTEPAPRRCALRVWDSGIGLPADLRPADSRSLGLRLVRTLVEQLGGSLAVEDRPGASFRIVFPTAPEP